MMTQQQLYDWIRHPDRLDRDTLYELRTLLARYPYFHTARLLYLKNLYLLHDATFSDELRRSALYVADRTSLFYLTEGGHYNQESLERDIQNEPTSGVNRTLYLIDSFLSAHTDEQPEKVVPVDITRDYTSFLLREPEEKAPAETPSSPSLKGQQLIDRFLENKPAEVPVLPVTEEEPDEDEEPVDNVEDENYFTETLAKIYVKQGRYSKALEIIKKLNLKYPKKNAYFADQIRFLEKLIINTKSK